MPAYLVIHVTGLEPEKQATDAVRSRGAQDVSIQIFACTLTGALQHIVALRCVGIPTQCLMDWFDASLVGRHTLAPLTYWTQDASLVPTA